jgi:WD40 repeat protein
MKNPNDNSALIMASLRPIHLHKMEAIWDAHPLQKLTLDEFVSVMRDLVRIDTLKGDVLITSLRALFHQIDANCDHFLEWHEIVSYVVDSGLLYRSSGLFRSHQMSFTVDSKYKDFSKHSRRISKMIYLHELQQMVLLDDTTSMKIFDPFTGQFVREINTVHFGPISVEFVADAQLRLILVGTGDGKVHVYDSQWSHMSSFALFTPQQVLRWCARAQVLLCASLAGRVSVHTISMSMVHGVRQVNVKNVGDLEGDQHTDVVEDMIEIEYMDAVVTASLDTTIRIWDITTRRLRKLLTGHRKGVRTLAFSQDQSLLFSAGYDREIHVWDAVCGALLFRLIGHSRPLVGLSILKDGMLLSGDAAGTFRLWDTKDLTLMHSFSDRVASSSQTPTDAFCFCACSNMLYTSAFSVQRFLLQAKDADGPESIGSDVPFSCALYNDANMMILVSYGRGLALIDAVTGTVSLKQPEAMPADITSMCLSSSGRKCFVGDSDGNVAEFNFSSLYKIRDLEGHSKEVSFVGCTTLSEILLTASWDQSLHLLEDSAGEGVLELKHSLQNCSSHDITCGAVSANMNFVAIGTANASVSLWDCWGGAPLGTMEAHEGELSQIVFLDPYPLFASADVDGRVCIWATHPASNRTELLLDIPGVATTDPARLTLQLADFPVAATALCWEPESKCLLVGDEEGRIRIIELASALNSMPTVKRMEAKYLRFTVQKPPASIASSHPSSSKHLTSDVPLTSGTVSIGAAERGFHTQNSSVIPDLKLRIPTGFVRISAPIQLKVDNGSAIRSIVALPRYANLIVVSDDVTVVGYSNTLSAQVREFVVRGSVRARRSAQPWSFFSQETWGVRQSIDMEEANDVASRIQSRALSVCADRISIVVDQVDEDGEMPVPGTVRFSQDLHPHGSASANGSPTAGGSRGPSPGPSSARESQASTAAAFDASRDWKELLRDRKSTRSKIITDADRQAVKREALTRLEEQVDENMLLMGAVVRGVLPPDAITDASKRMHALQFLRQAGRR